MNRNGGWIFDSQLFYVCIIIVLGFAFAGLMIAIQFYRTAEFEFPEGVESYLVSQRFLRCFGESGIINYDKFTQAHLDICYPVDKTQKYFAYTLTLDNQLVLKTANWDDSRVSSAGRRALAKIKRSNQITEGMLLIEVQK